MTAPDLARQLVEHPRWTWQPGMVTTHHVEPYGSKLVASPGIVDFNGCPEGRQRHGRAWWVTPDIDHPATKGWLLHMLREACVCVQLHHDPVDLSVYAEWVDASGVTHRDWFRGDGALAAALLAAWGVS